MPVAPTAALAIVTALMVTNFMMCQGAAAATPANLSPGSVDLQQSVLPFSSFASSEAKSAFGISRRAP